MDGAPWPGYHLAIEPRGLSLLQAAMYVGVSPSMFVVLIRAGKMPRPKVIGSHRIWDRYALDASFAELPDKFALPEYRPPSDGGQGDGSRAFPIVVPPPTREQIAAVRLRMDMERYGQSTEGMTDAQIDKLEAQWYERWKNNVIASPLNKREKAALPHLYQGRDRVFRHGEIKGAGWTTEDRLEVRGYVKLHKMNDLTVSWQITDAGIEAYLLILAPANRAWNKAWSRIMPRASAYLSRISSHSQVMLSLGGTWSWDEITLVSWRQYPKARHPRAPSSC